MTFYPPRGRCCRCYGGCRCRGGGLVVVVVVPCQKPPSLPADVDEKMREWAVLHKITDKCSKEVHTIITFETAELAEYSEDQRLELQERHMDTVAAAIEKEHRIRTEAAAAVVAEHQGHRDWLLEKEREWDDDEETATVLSDKYSRIINYAVNHAAVAKVDMVPLSVGERWYLNEKDKEKVDDVVVVVVVVTVVVVVVVVVVVSCFVLSSHPLQPCVCADRVGRLHG